MYAGAPRSLPFHCDESGLQVPACARLRSGMETSPSQRLEVLVLADQDFEDMFLEDTQARLGRVSHREYDHVASLPTIYHLIPRSFSILTMTQ